MAAAFTSHAPYNFLSFFVVFLIIGKLIGPHTRKVICFFHCYGNSGPIVQPRPIHIIRHFTTGELSVPFPIRAS